MKQTITTFLALLLFLSYGNSQSRFGLTVGSSIMTARPESVYIGNVSDYATHEVRYMGGNTPFNIGFTYQNKIGWMFMQPSIQYSQYSVKYEVEAFQDAYKGVTKATEKYKNLDIYCTAGVHSDNFRVGFGPAFHIIMDFEDGLKGTPTYESRLSRWVTGFTGSVGFDFYPISIDLRYEGSFNSFGDHIFLNKAKSKLEGGPDQINFSITYSIPYKNTYY